MTETHRVYTLPFAPVALNQAYSTRVIKKGRKSIPIRYLQPAYKAFKATVKEYLEKTDEGHGGKITFSPPFNLYFLFLMEKSSWFFKNGNIRKRDVSNYFKLLEDACSEYWDVDDTHNITVKGDKRWVPDGELTEFVEDAYDSPPHKTLRAIIKLVVSPLPEDNCQWDGKLEIPGVSLIE